MNIEHAIKLCRAAKQVSLDELATRLGVSESYLSLIEAGKRDPRLSTVSEIAAALGVPLPVLLLLAAEADELKGLDSNIVGRLSEAAINAIRR